MAFKQDYQGRNIGFGGFDQAAAKKRKSRLLFLFAGTICFCLISITLTVLVGSEKKSVATVTTEQPADEIFGNVMLLSPAEPVPQQCPPPSLQDESYKDSS